MGRRKQYIVQVGVQPLAVGCLTDATNLVRLLSKMDRIERDYHHPQDHRRSPVYRPCLDEVSMREIRLEPVAASDDEVTVRTVASRCITSDRRQLPQQLRLPDAGTDGQP